MTPQEQAEAILKAAEYVRFKTLAKTQGDLAKEDYAWIRSLPANERSGLIDWPHEKIALALLEKHKALEEAEAHIQILLDIFEPIPGSETSLDDKRMIREARAFLSRISTASSTLDAIRDELGGEQG